MTTTPWTTKKSRRTTSATNTKRKQQVALGLGANLGDPRATLAAAAGLLSAVLEPCRAASLYATRPLSDIPQPDFLNTVILGSTALAPLELLHFCSELERLAGRRRGPRNGPRVLDIDLLLFGDECFAVPGLEIPHPRMRQRRFVLEPLAELAPDLRLPPDGLTVAQLLAVVGQQDQVTRLEPLC